MKKANYIQGLSVAFICLLACALPSCKKDSIIPYGTYTGGCGFAPFNLAHLGKVIITSAGANNLLINDQCCVGFVYKATFSGDSLTIPNQNGISGYGHFSGSELGIHISASEDTALLYTCNFGGTLQ